MLALCLGRMNVHHNTYIVQLLYYCAVHNQHIPVLENESEHRSPVLFGNFACVADALVLLRAKGHYRRRTKGERGHIGAQGFFSVVVGLRRAVSFFKEELG